MQKKIAGAIGVLSAVAALDCAQAAAPSATNASEFLKPQSFAELLQPVPNALALLKEVDEPKRCNEKPIPNWRNISTTTTTTTITIIITIIITTLTTSLDGVRPSSRNVLLCRSAMAA